MGNIVGSPRHRRVTPYRLIPNGREVSSKNLPNTPTKLVISPEYISGYADGEGSFLVSFSPRQKLSVGLEVRPSFSISQRNDRSQVLTAIKKYFGCGNIRLSRKDSNDKYEVRSLRDLRDIIIPHFKKYQILSSKQKDFELFTHICELMIKGEHKSTKGIQQIIHLACQMNTGGSRRYLKRELLASLKI